MYRCTFILCISAILPYLSQCWPIPKTSYDISGECDGLNMKAIVSNVLTALQSWKKRKIWLLLSWSDFLKNNQLCFCNEYRVTYPLYTRLFIKLKKWHIPSYPTAFTLIFLRKIAWKTRERVYHNMEYGALFIQRASYRIHYCDVRMCVVASQITSLTIVYSNVYSDADKKHQSSGSLAFVWGIHRGPVSSPHKWPVTRKMFPFDDVIMWKILCTLESHHLRSPRRLESMPYDPL